MENNVIPLFKKKEFKNTTTNDYKIKLEYLLEKEILSLEDFEDFNKFLCALALIITDTSIYCVYETNKAPNPEIYCNGLKKILIDRYEREGINFAQ